jgi:hypothetical protein
VITSAPISQKCMAAQELPICGRKNLRGHEDENPNNARFVC